MKKNTAKRVYLFFTAFLASLLICVLITGILVQSMQQVEYMQMERLVLSKRNKINEVISRLLYKAQTLSALVIQSNGEMEDFEKVAATIVDDPAILNIIIAPGGVISKVYPLDGNEQVIGFRYFEEGAGNKEAVAARETGELVLGGPFELVQGGMALVGRLPVYLKEETGERKFWGLVSVTLKYPEVLEGAELDKLEEEGFSYELWRINPDTGQKQVIASDQYIAFKNGPSVEKEISIFHSEWFLKVSPIKMWYQHPETWIYSISGLLISLLIAFLVRHNYDLKQIKKELESMVWRDYLTGLYNRSRLFADVDQMMAEEKKAFILCYMDLNNFKQVNDSYGHNSGDLVLQQFAEKFKKHIGPSQVLFRVGGDEFVLLFKGTDNQAEAKKFFDQMKQEFKKPVFLCRKESLCLSFSVGFAVYPEDGESIDELIAAADSRMYDQKNGEKP